MHETNHGKAVSQSGSICGCPPDAANNANGIGSQACKQRGKMVSEYWFGGRGGYVIVNVDGEVEQKGKNGSVLKRERKGVL